ncbi:MAG: glycosyltransferase family 1 protein [Balneolaceae bacterium]
MKIAIFTGNYNHIRDGVSLTLNRLVEFLEGEGEEVLVFGPTVDEPAFQHNGTLIPVPSIAMPGRPEYRISTRFPKPARRTLEEFGPDLIQISTPDVLGYHALLWARRNRVPVVSSYHTHFTSYLKYYNLNFLESFGWSYMRWFYGHSSQIFVPTRSMWEELEEKGIKGDFRIWARGVDTVLFNPARRDNDWRSRYGFDQEDVIISYVSRLVWEKNPDIFAHTIQKLEKKYPAVKPMIVGEGPALDGLKELLPEATYSGFLTGVELADAYANSDIFLFPSDTESFGNVTLEAMASGLPCVVADATGSKSLVDDRVNGYLVSVSRPDKFVEAVEHLVKDSQLRKQMGSRSVEKAGNYTWDQINQQLLSNYREAIQSLESGS